MLGLGDLIELDILLRATTEGMESFDKAEGGLAGLGRAAAATALVLGTGLAVGLGESIKQASEFQRQMLMIQTQAGATTENLTQMSAAVEALAPKVGIGPTQLAEALYHLESAGFRGAGALDALQGAAELSQVGQADLESTTQALVGVLSAYPQYVGHANEALGIMNAIVGSGDMRMQGFAKSLATGLLPAAQNVKLSLTDVGAALATLTDNVTPPDEAATRLRMTFALLEHQSGPAANALDQIGIKSGQLGADMVKPNGLLVAVTDLRTHLEATFGGKALDDLNHYVSIMDSQGVDAANKYAAASAGAANTIMEAFGGGRTSAAIETLLGEFDKFKDKYALINQGAQNFQSDWEKTTQNFSFQTDRLKASAETVAIEIGTHLLPVATALESEVADHIVPAFTSFWGWIDSRVTPAAHDFGHELDTYVVPVLGAFWSLLTDDVVPAAHDLWDMFSNYVLPVLADLAKWAAGDIKTDLTWLHDHFELVVAVGGALVALKVADWAVGVGKAVADLANSDLFAKLADKFGAIFLPNITGSKKAESETLMYEQGLSDGTSYRRGWLEATGGAGIPGSTSSGGRSETVLGGASAEPKGSSIKAGIGGLAAGGLGMALTAPGIGNPIQNGGIDWGTVLNDLFFGTSAAGALGGAVSIGKGLLGRLGGGVAEVPGVVPPAEAPVYGYGGSAFEGGAGYGGPTIAGETGGSAAEAVASGVEAAAPSVASQIASKLGPLGILATTLSLSSSGSGTTAGQQMDQASAAAGAQTALEKEFAYEYKTYSDGIQEGIYKQQDLNDLTTKFVNKLGEAPQTMAQLTQEDQFIRTEEHINGWSTQLSNVDAALVQGEGQLLSVNQKSAALPGYGKDWSNVVEMVNGKWQTTQVYLSATAAMTAAAQSNTAATIGPASALSGQFGQTRADTGATSSELANWNVLLQNADGTLTSINAKLLQASVPSVAGGAGTGPIIGAAGAPIQINTAGGKAPPPMFPGAGGISLPMTNSADVVSWYNSYLGRNPSPDEIKYWTGIDRLTAENAIKTSQEAAAWKASFGGSSSHQQSIRSFATGAYFPASVGGQVINIAEGGEGEAVIPDSKLIPTFAPVINAITAAMGGGGMSAEILAQILGVLSANRADPRLIAELQRQTSLLQSLSQSMTGGVNVGNARAMAGARAA